MPVAEFGPLVTEVDVDRAVIKTLRLWLPTYLAQVERERELKSRLLARPREDAYANTLEDEDFIEHPLPSIIVTTAQTDDVQKDGNGIHFASWRTVVTAVVRGRTPPEAREVAALFGGSVRRLLVQQGSLGGFAGGGTKLTGNRVVPVEDTSGENRELAAAINEFRIYVDDVLDGDAGPMLPDPIYEDSDPVGSPDDPYEPLAAVSNVTISVEGVPLNREPGS